MRKAAVLLVATAALGLLPGTAHAQKFFGGFTGWSYGDSAGECDSVWSGCENRKTGYGFVVGGTGGLFGFETEFAWTSDFWQGAELNDSKVSTIMTNVLVGFPIGPLRPYGAFGFGAIKARMEFTAASWSDFSDTAFGYDYGAGVIVMLPAHLGVRLDYRRFTSGPTIPVIGGIFGDGNDLEFSRVSVGVVLH